VPFLCEQSGVGDPDESGALATVLGLPGQSTRRACEELNAHALIVRRKSSEADNSPNLWAPARRTVGFWEKVSPREPA
jgi:hypothetical protein